MITGQNNLLIVVGYQEVPVEASGFTLITPTFDKVDGSSITLKDIGAKNSYESVQLLNTDAGTDAEYFFVSKEDSGLEADGWFLDDTCEDNEDEDD